MIKNFKELEEYVLSNQIKKSRIVLVNAHDEPALSALVNARRNGVVEGILLGDAEKIVDMLHEIGESEKDYEIINCIGEELDVAKAGIQLIYEGKADIPMKGILQTSNYTRAILAKEFQLIPAGGLISLTSAFEYNDRLIILTDCGINIDPDADKKINIIKNALPMAAALGIENPKVAILSAVEKPSPKILSTQEALDITARGVEGCTVSGPLALDGAISEESAKHKGINDPVAGHADILVMPDLDAGNICFKAITYIAGKSIASTISGVKCPVVITSRADTPESKYYSILLSALRVIKGC